MHLKFDKFLEQERCIYNLKFGFHVNCSANDTLMSIIENMHTHLGDGKYLARVFADLGQKGFSTVDHGILSKKLEHGVKGVRKDCFISYLRGKTIC